MVKDALPLNGLLFSNVFSLSAWSLPTAEDVRWNAVLVLEVWLSLARLLEVPLPSFAFTLLELAVNAARPVVRSMLMASVAEPFCASCAFLTSPLRASLSHQNSHARESLERPLGRRRRGKPSLLPWLEQKESVMPVPLKDFLRLFDGISLGGDGDDSSGPRTLAPPSEVMDRRTPDRVRLSDLVIGGEHPLNAGRGTDEGIVNSLDKIGLATEEDVKVGIEEEESTNGGSD